MRELYPYMQMIAFFLMLFTACYRPSMLGVDRKTVLYVAWLTFILGYPVKYLVFHYLPAVGGVFLPGKEAVDLLTSLPLNFILGVWWEDCFFVLPALYAWRWAEKPYLSQKSYMRRGYVAYAVNALCFCAFVYGHSYQGPIGLLTSIYWLFSYQTGKRFGLGTPILCHLCIDLSNILFLKYLIAHGGIL